MNWTGIMNLGIAAWLVGVAASSAAAAEVTLSVEQAVAEGKIDLEIKSLGRSSGPCMKLVIRRRVPETIRLTVQSGIVFKSLSGKVQNMVAAKVLGEFNAAVNTYKPDGLMILRDDATHAFILDAYCLDSGKPTPGLKEGFLWGEIDVRVHGILELAISRKATTSDIQMAIWIDRPAPGVTVPSLMVRVNATEVNVKTARSILSQLEIDGLDRWIVPGVLENLRVDVEGRPPGGMPPLPPALGDVDIGRAIGTVENILGAVGDGPPVLGSVRVLDAGSFSQVTVTGEDGSAQRKSAAEDRTLLILQLAVPPKIGPIRLEDCAVSVEGQSLPAFAASRFTEPLDPKGTPKFEPVPAGYRPKSLPMRILGENRWQVGFEIPEGATHGTLRYRGLAEVEWSLQPDGK